MKTQAEILAIIEKEQQSIHEEDRRTRKLNRTFENSERLRDLASDMKAWEKLRQRILEKA